METKMSTYAATPRTTLRRLPTRGSYERDTVHAILDEALVAHLGFVQEAQPFVIPTIHARVGDVVYVHGSAASRMLRGLARGIPACLTVTLVDGLVLARSAFHHSMNYRSVVVLGAAELVTDDDEKRRALDAIVEHVAPGRSAEVRGPNEKELKATSVLRLGLDECSAKVRTGGPVDDEEDYALPCWAGVLPLRLVAGQPLADSRLQPGTEISASIAAWARDFRAGSQSPE
jgi:nitroimidazol reductase NimA-like FMN-containing flavoprotein (pyridoxamine 5'-phosphate oxidase superfamily)